MCAEAGSVSLCVCSPVHVLLRQLRRGPAAVPHPNTGFVHLERENAHTAKLLELGPRVPGTYSEPSWRMCGVRIAEYPPRRGLFVCNVGVHVFLVSGASFGRPPATEAGGDAAASAAVLGSRSSSHSSVGGGCAKVVAAAAGSRMKVGMLAVAGAP